MANPIDSQQAFTGVAQTAAIGSSTSTSSGAAKIFREFKWGLLTLFILMAVVICLVYDGGRKKKTETAQAKPNTTLDNLGDSAASDTTGANTTLTGGTTNIGIMPPEASNGPGAVDRSGINVNGNTANRAANEGNDLWNPNNISGAPLVRSDNNAANNGANQNLANGARRGNGFANNFVPHDPPNAEDNSRTTRSNTRATTETRSRTEASFTMYTVKPGDSLSKIASENLHGKGGLKAIIDANKDTLPDPNRLREGMKLKIPATISASTESTTSRDHKGATIAENQQTTGASNERHSAPNASTQDDYVVQSGDSLERIARRVLNDSRKWKDLLEWNKDRISDASKLRVGMVLRTHPTGQATTIITPEGWRNRNNMIRAGSDPETPRDREEINGEETTIPVHPITTPRGTVVPANRNAENPSVEPKEPAKTEPAESPLHGL
ncbi:MAG TPA: LysM peptidoglycan-binding domain-containing protein [Planctomycetota bacterium]|nr:LysM peptidoglycan-binding domain-containing protein [Planctomycetota bacterium]